MVAQIHDQPNQLVGSAAKDVSFARIKMAAGTNTRTVPGRMMMALISPQCMCFPLSEKEVIENRYILDPGLSNRKSQCMAFPQPL